MNSHILQIALKIARIKEEFSENDISKAIKLLEEQHFDSTLLSYLIKHNKTPLKKTNEGNSKRKTKKIEEQQSRALISLKRKSPDKYQALIEFESLLRKGSILPKLRDIKRLRERLSKDFAPIKSRREAISALMTILAEKSLDEIREIVTSNLANTNESCNEYQELAQFIINGAVNRNNQE